MSRVWAKEFGFVFHKSLIEDSFIIGICSCSEPARKIKPTKSSIEYFDFNIAPEIALDRIPTRNGNKLDSNLQTYWRNRVNTQ